MIRAREAYNFSNQSRIVFHISLSEKYAVGIPLKENFIPIAREPNFFYLETKLDFEDVEWIFSNFLHRKLS